MSSLPSEIPPETPRSEQRGRGRFTTAIAVLALAASIYGLLRIDSTRERLATVRDSVRSLEASQSVLRDDLNGLAEQQAQGQQDLQSALATLSGLPQRVADLNSTMEEVRGRTDRPQRTWIRAEALFLLKLAERRLTLEHDVATAIAALEAADGRLQELGEAGLAPVREQLSAELQALRKVPQPDRSALQKRLQAAAAAAATLTVSGVQIGRSPGDEVEYPQQGLARAWARIRNAFASLISVRKLQENESRLLTETEQSLRREHLQLTLSSAQHALLRGDAESYRSSLSAALHSLEQHFDIQTPAAQSLVNELRALAQVDTAPALPDIGATARLLEKTQSSRQPS